jgi:hydrogenase nickel insertion protein HypA
MHEFSIISQIISSVTDEAKKRNASVKEVQIEIGELMSISEDAARFAYKTLTENTILSNSKLVVYIKKATAECDRCGYRGDLSYIGDEISDGGHEHDHTLLADFKCSKCGNKLRIADGNDCRIKSIVLVEGKPSKSSHPGSKK